MAGWFNRVMKREQVRFYFSLRSDLTFHQAMLHVAPLFDGSIYAEIASNLNSEFVLSVAEARIAGYKRRFDIRHVALSDCENLEKISKVRRSKT